MDILLTALLAAAVVTGCSLPQTEGAAARLIRQQFETCRVEAGAFDSKLRWVAPDGSAFRVDTQLGASERMQKCLRETTGARFVR